jgi:hypothetical protein
VPACVLEEEREEVRAVDVDRPTLDPAAGVSALKIRAAGSGRDVAVQSRRSRGAQAGSGGCIPQIPNSTKGGGANTLTSPEPRQRARRSGR